MSYVYKCTCYRAKDGFLKWGDKYKETTVDEKRVCTKCGHYAVAFAKTKHPRSKGIGGYKPVAKPRTLYAMGYPQLDALRLNGIDTWQIEHYFPWQFKINRLEYYKEYYKQNKEQE